MNSRIISGFAILVLIFTTYADALCEAPSFIEGGHMIPAKKQFQIGENLNVRCYNGHILAGRSSTCTCMTDGSFDPPLPKCKTKADMTSCKLGADDIPVNGFVIPNKPKYYNWNKFYYRCTEGYWLEGARSNRCINGEIAPLQARCVSLADEYTSMNMEERLKPIYKWKELMQWLSIINSK